MSAPAPIRLQLLPDAPDADGQPRCGLLVPPAPSSLSRRPILVLFHSLGAAIAAKATMERGQ
jgi:hypothetical protein